LQDFQNFQDKCVYFGTDKNEVQISGILGRVGVDIVCAWIESKRDLNPRRYRVAHHLDNNTNSSHYSTVIHRRDELHIAALPRKTRTDQNMQGG